MITDVLIDITVRVGYHGKESDQTRPIRFTGMELTNATNYSEVFTHPNHTRWHKWTLYKVENGFRVLDEFFSRYKSESNHTGLSAVLKSPAEVSRMFPEAANAAVANGFWKPEEIVTEASESAENGKAGTPRFEEG